MSENASPTVLCRFDLQFERSVSAGFYIRDLQDGSGVADAILWKAVRFSGRPGGACHRDEGEDGCTNLHGGPLPAEELLAELLYCGVNVGAMGAERFTAEGAESTEGEGFCVGWGGLVQKVQLVAFAMAGTPLWVGVYNRGKCRLALGGGFGYLCAPDA